jgi:hypothetical protein
MRQLRPDRCSSRRPSAAAERTLVRQLSAATLRLLSESPRDGNGSNWVLAVMPDCRLSEHGTLAEVMLIANPIRTKRSITFLARNSHRLLQESGPGARRPGH